MPRSNRSYPPDAGDLRWQDYEELVKDIYQALGHATGVAIECWGNSCRVQGRSGVSHQIDVLTSHSDGLHRYRTGISCKHWSERVGKSKVMEFAQVVTDAALSKGVMVSKMGFTGPAKQYANATNIGLVELRKPLDKDWDGFIREVRGEIIIDQSRIRDVRFRLNAPRPNPDQQTYVGGPINWALRLDQFVIAVPGQKTETLQQLVDATRRRDPDMETYDLQFPDGSILTVPDHLDYPAHGLAITDASFKVEDNPPLSAEFVFCADDHIYMIMESLFDGRRFTITVDGEIIETTA